jgi:hypothetical protein
MSDVAVMTARLGLRSVFDDHSATWTLRVGAAGARDRQRAFAWYYGLPSLAALPFFWIDLQVQGVGQLLAGVAVFTALLFGLLILIFNTGLALRKDGNSLASAHDVKRVIADLRANVTYAALVAITLAMVLVVAAALTPSTKGLAWGWTPALVWLFLHLGLNLLTILARFRTAFNYITR